MKHYFFTLMMLLAALGVSAADPSGVYTWENLAGSARPYPDTLRAVIAPDSLTPVMILHVSRHGARYPTTGACATEIRALLMKAYDSGTLTARGRSLLALADSICQAGNGRWGRLDPLGEKEQRAIAACVFQSAPGLFTPRSRIDAVASWKPRCVMSMYTFVHQLMLMQPEGLQVTAVSGTARSDTLLRFFDTDAAYKELKKSDILTKAADDYEAMTVDDATATRILRRLVGKSLRATALERRWEAMAVYSLISSAGAMSIEVNPGLWMTADEYARCWASKNLSQYLRYSASSLSDIPANMAAPLLRDMVESADRFVEGGDVAPVRLYFGHAETLMPLMSLMHIARARYVNPDLSTVRYHWHNFDIVPMAANITVTLFRSRCGDLYARLDVNGEPEPLVAGEKALYVRWDTARGYLRGLLDAQ